MVFVTFYGDAKTPVGHHTGKLMNIPMIILAVLSLVGGFIELPHTMGHLELFSEYLEPVFPTITLKANASTGLEWTVQLVTIVLSLGGVYIAYYFYLKKPEMSGRIKASVESLHQFWLKGWGFDAVYHAIFVRPFVFLATINKDDVVDKFYALTVSASEVLHDVFAKTQGGILRWYVMSIVIGAILILTLGLLL